jgi:outer membrane lipoprotein-sorting protein
MKKLFFIISGLLTVCILSAQDVKLDEILAKYLKAIGQDKVTNVQTSKMTGRMSQGGVELLMTDIEKRPDMMRQELEMQGTKVIAAYDGKNGWMINPLTGSVDPQDMSPEMITGIKEETENDPYGIWINPLNNWKAKGCKVELIGKEDLNGTPVYNIKVSFTNNKVVNYYIDSDKFITIKIKYQDNIQGQPVDKEDLFSDFRVVDGLMTPFKTEARINGQVESVITVDKWELNIPLGDSMFIKPAIKK